MRCGLLLAVVTGCALDPALKTRCRDDRDCNSARICNASGQCVSRASDLGQDEPEAGAGDRRSGEPDADSMEPAPLPDAVPDAAVALTPPLEPAAADAGSGTSCACERPEAHLKWTFPNPQQSYFNVDQQVQVHAGEAGVSWLEGVYFDGESALGATLGFESDGERPDGSRGKVAIFSMTGATGSSGPHCTVSNDPEPVTTCRVAFDFLPDHDYVWRIWILDQDASLWWWWGAWVIDARGVGGELEIGSLRGPPGRRAIARTDNHVRYRELGAQCEAPRPSSARFSPPLLDGSAWRAQTDALGEHAMACRAAEVKVAPEGVEVSFGAP